MKVLASIVYILYVISQLIFLEGRKRVQGGGEILPKVSAKISGVQNFKKTATLFVTP